MQVYFTVNLGRNLGSQAGMHLIRASALYGVRLIWCRFHCNWTGGVTYLAIIV